MATPVDLTALREITDGDPELERELFQVFFASAETCIIALDASTGVDTQETWRKQAHAFKGIALNIGAQELGAWCKKAQDASSESAQHKHALLQDIKTAYAQVTAFLKAI